MRSEVDEDVLVRASRALLYVGLFASSLLTLRLSASLAVGDIFLIASAGLLVAALRRDSNTGDASVQLLAVVLVVVGGALSTVRADSVGGTLLVVVRLAYLIGVLPWQLKSLLRTTARVTTAAYAWVAGAAACGAGSIIQAMFGANAIPGTTITNAGRYTGFTQNVSDAGAITSIAVAFCLGGLGGGVGGRRRWCCVGFALLSAFGLLLSGSVSGLTVVVLAIAILLVRHTLSFGRVVRAGLIAFVALVIISPIEAHSGSLSPLQRIYQVTGHRSYSANAGLDTTNTRLQLDGRALSGLLSHPVVGRGLDDQSAIVDPADELPAHNLFIDAGFEGGLAVLIGLIVAIAEPLRRAWPAALRSSLGAQLLAALAGSVLFAMTAPSLFNRYLWIPVALSLAYNRVSDSASTSELISVSVRPGWTSTSQWSRGSRDGAEPAQTGR